MGEYQPESSLRRAHLPVWQYDIREEQRSATAPHSTDTATATAVTAPTVTAVAPSLALLGQLRAAPPAVARRTLQQLQHSHGNRVVQRLLQLRGNGSHADVAPEVERAIDGSRGGGRPLDSSTRTQMNQAFNADFSGVRVHTSAEADSLNRSLNARAFTTGRDIYFRQGQYNPGSSGGRELLAHELTHVVQQNAELVQGKYKDDEVATSSCSRCASPCARKAIQAKLTLGSPGDVYEQEADSVARAFSRWELQPSGGKETGAGLQRQPMTEEEKKKGLKTKSMDDRLLRQPEEEKKKEEPLRTQLETSELQRQPEEEEKKKKPI
jgi:hypothetical protein